MSKTGKAFIARSRYHLKEDYLPKIERCLELITDEQTWWRANPESNSIGNLLLHLSGNVRQWIVCGLGGARDTRDRDAEFAQREIVSRGELLKRLQQTLSDADQTLAVFDPDKLLKLYRIQGLEQSALDAILHVVEHFSMHAGQIFLLTKVLAKEELAFYDFSTGNPVGKWRGSRANDPAK